MTDQEIIQKLIERDNRVTTMFFFDYCKPVFLSVIHKVFDYEVDYDEFVNELYIFLMNKDAKKLRDLKLESQYALKSWLIITATRFFIKKRNRLIKNKSQEPLYEEMNDDMEVDTAIETDIDIERILSKMPNQRYAYVIKKLILEDMAPEDLASEMETATANIYNIKKRAIAQLTLVLFQDIKNYKKQ